CMDDKETPFGRFLKFETVTLCYIDQALIEPGLLTVPEAEWLNDYHKSVFEKISPHLNDDEKLWLKSKTEMIV
ncbi:MAG: aminopeptidase P family protein, partial [Bacteroidia bacterium]